MIRISPTDANPLQRNCRNVEHFVKTFVNAVCKVLAGSDPAVIDVPGIGNHQGMKLLVNSRLRPEEALNMGNSYPAAESINYTVFEK